jgi:hypothetical protein
MSLANGIKVAFLVDPLKPFSFVFVPRLSEPLKRKGLGKCYEPCHVACVSGSCHRSLIIFCERMRVRVRTNFTLVEGITWLASIQVSLGWLLPI